MIVIKNKKQALSFLSQGNVLVLPSETSYGLSCLASSQTAVDKIFAIKKRDKNKSLLVVVPTVALAKEYLKWNGLLDKLAKKYWPGALTIISGVKESNLAKGVVDDSGTLALRVTNHPILKYLSSKSGQPLVSTSANISGREAIYDIKEAIELLGKRKIKPDAVFDYGRLPKNEASTIMSVVGGGLRVVRQGGLKILNPKFNCHSDRATERSEWRNPLTNFNTNGKGSLHSSLTTCGEGLGRDDR